MEITAEEFIQNASRYLAAAEAGETVIITRNGRPVARMQPYDAEAPREAGDRD